MNNTTDDSSLDLSSYFRSKDYYRSNTNDKKELDLDLYYNKRFENNWRYYFKLYRDYDYNRDEGLSQRWGWKTYFLKDFGNLDCKFTLEKWAPDYDDEDKENKVTYYRWPEMEVNYSSAGPFAYKFQVGNYYEADSKIKAWRGNSEVNYHKSWPVTDKLKFTTYHNVLGRVYKSVDKDTMNYYKQYPGYYLYGLPCQLGYNNTNTISLSLFPGVNWVNKYIYANYIGESPFDFDADRSEKIRSYLRYTKRGLNASLSVGYDIYNQTYYPILTIVKWLIKENWKVGFGTSYDPDDGSFTDLVTTHSYKNENWQINNRVKYDINNNLFKEINNKISYEINEQLHFELNTEYDYDESEFESANIEIKKNFHCRSLTFSYDYINQEYAVEYNINLFPDAKVKAGGSQEESLIFDIGIDKLLDIE